jgi:hypothetical protein
MSEDNAAFHLRGRSGVAARLGASAGASFGARVALLAAALLVASGCSDDSWFGAEKYCGDTRTAPKVYNGTLLPSYVPLTPEQMPSIGSFRLCSGTLIAPNWVITAKHCGLNDGVQFCIGSDPAVPDQCISSYRVVNHPDVDMTLVELLEDARTRVPGLKPLGVMSDRMDGEWIGRQAEASGYGETQNGTLGTRYFTSEPIVSLERGYVTIDGQGQRGVCFGDSGGPVLVIADDGSIRVAGVLSNGDESCLGRDNFTRTDLQLAWIEQYTGPLDSGGSQGCGQIGRVGRCESGRAVWCSNESIQTEECAAPAACGWDEAAAGFRCITGPDPCEGFDGFGGCEGNVARWCDDGVPRYRDCTICNQICVSSADVQGAYCVDDACQGLGYLGRCNGDVAEWCEGGQISRRDCGALGLTCGLVNDQIGYYCVDPSTSMSQAE